MVCLFAVFFTSCRKTVGTADPLGLKEKLEGRWEAAAFSGTLHESWKLGTDGWMQQEGYYIEAQDTVYSAKTKIEKVEDEVILFSVIAQSAPKIFKATELSSDKMVFENSDYKNPFRVTYEFSGKEGYKRTITGYEKDSLVRYVFQFKRMDTP